MNALLTLLMMLFSWKGATGRNQRGTKKGEKKHAGRTGRQRSKHMRGSPTISSSVLCDLCSRPLLRTYRTAATSLSSAARRATMIRGKKRWGLPNEAGPVSNQTKPNQLNHPFVECIFTFGLFRRAELILQTKTGQASKNLFGPRVVMFATM